MPAYKSSHEPLPADRRDKEPFRWRPRQVGGLLRETLREFVEDKSPKQAAALAYYTLFALGPLLLLAIGLASLALGSGAQDAVLAQARALLGVNGAAGIEELLRGADRRRVGALGTALGLALLLVSAGAVFAQLKEALNRIWEVQAKKAVGWKAKLVRAVRKNFLSFAGVVGTGFLLLVSLVVSAALAAVGDAFASAFPGAAPLLQVVNVVLSLVVVSLLFALLFKFLPDARVAWRDVAIGAVATAVLFLLGQLALAYYLGAGPLSTRYGAAGALLLVLVWVYYSSLIVFLGAEFTQVFANRYGSHVRESRDARPLPEAVAAEQDAPEREGVGRRARKGGRGVA